MHENSLFAILLRSPWWISLLAGAGVFALTRALLPAAYANFAFFAALPFLVIGTVAGWRQLRAPSAERVAANLEALRALSWEAFSGALETAYRNQGYTVSPASVPGADIELSKAVRVSLVSCKRWKVARAGIEPLRDLDAARRKAQASECIFVAAGDVTENAVAFAAEKGIQVLRGPELAALVKAPA
jgi:restriction system protein